MQQFLPAEGTILKLSDHISVGFDAVRLCEAIAKIGYEPYTAIMDLVDNSVTAGAKEIKVTLGLHEGKTLKSKNGVAYYQIVDNGKGMNEDEIVNAFKIGSERNYSENSLSKYGMGLKSAGLSLGTSISIFSKKNKALSYKYTFDLEVIKKINQISVVRTQLTDEETEQANILLSGKSGTVVTISGCENINQSSPNLTITKLRERLGVVYSNFLSRPKPPLSILFRVVKNNEDTAFEEATPKDLLFLEEAKKHTDWNPKTYDFATPYLVLDELWDAFKDKNDEPLSKIRIQAVAFPQAVLADTKSPLSPESKEKIRVYRISRENSGFFIYRNGRLIRWGDSLGRPNGKPLIGKDDINLRFRFEILTEHDDILHVDVSKQRLEIDDEILGSLENVVSQAIRTAKQIRQACQEKLKVRHTEGESFNQTVIDVTEDDPQELSKGSPNKTTLERQNKLNQEAQKKLQEIKSKRESNDTSDSESVATDSSLFKKIRYEENFPPRQLWKTFFDSLHGAFIIVNKSHPFFEEFISRFENGTPERLTIEALMFSAGVAENNVFNYEHDIDTAKLENAFRRFHRNIDSFLVDWAYENQGEE
jgi:hypothetical protein